jgi:RNA polymerase sigma-70 factor (ECF subfamily)
MAGPGTGFAFAALALLAAGPAGAAIVHDRDLTRSSGDQAALAFDATVGAGADRYLLAAVTIGGSRASVTGASFAGAPLGFLGATTSPAANCRLEWWGLVSPAEGAQPFRLEATTPSPFLDVTLLSYRGVAGLGAVGAFASSSGVTGPSQVTVASGPGELVIDGACGWASDSVLLLAGPHQEARWHWSIVSLSSAGSSQPAEGASVTASWTASGPGVMEWAAGALTLRPAGTPVAVDLTIGSSGCALGGPTSAGPAWLFLIIVAVWAFGRAGPGTSPPAARGTDVEMRLSTSRALPLRAPPADRLPELDGLTLARAKQGDRAAQTALVHRYQRPVYALLWRMVGPQQAVVEDLTQETFLRVLRALDRFEHDDGRARMITWILSIASRLAIDHLRACRHRTDTAAVPGALPVALPRPDHEASRRALGCALVDAVETLAPQFRAAFLLREVHGLSYDEISQALSVDVGTVKSRLARARAALQAALAELRDE